MSAFSPDRPPPVLLDAGETAARFLPTALRRMPSVAKPWGVVRVVVLGLLTIGFYPCHALYTRLRETIQMHAQQIDLTSAWFAARLPADDARVLTDAAAAVRGGRAGLAAGTAALLAAIACAAAWFGRHGVGVDSVRRWIVLPRDGLALTSASLLTFAYLLAVARMNRQLLAMQQFALAFDATHDGPTPLAPPPLAWGLRPTYVAVGVGLAALGMVWALPMMLAWAALREFAETAAGGLRAELAGRLTAASGVTPVLPPAMLCTNPDCRLTSAADARFCPRCGRSTRPA